MKTARDERHSAAAETASTSRSEPLTLRHLLVALALLWLVGNALRLPILAVPPVLTAMQADLRMSGTEIGILSGLPVVLFALAALPGSLLIARIGAVPALVVGLLVAALGSGLRGFVDSIAVLYATTVVMGAGIAVMQPALPAVVRQWTPQRIGLATAVFTNGLIVGEVIPVAVMIPVVLPLLDASWRGALAFWALPMVLIAALTVAVRPRSRGTAISIGHERPRWWPDWNNPLVWRLGLILGSANSAYFGANTFLPGYLDGAGRADLIAHALTALNLGQLPVSLLLLALAPRFERKAWPLVAFGIGSLVAMMGIVTTASAWTIVFAAALGFCAAGTLVLALALPPLLRAPADVGPTSAAMFAIGYGEAVLASVLGGAAWDLFGGAGFAFWPLALSVLPLVLLPRTVGFTRRA
ncbi:MAG TPA: MFS transporter [Xanthobacteraceae bacterium]|nr:MFS transporter [Xanthobacteraceae bacterium]